MQIVPGPTAVAIYPGHPHPNDITQTAVKQIVVTTAPAKAQTQQPLPFRQLPSLQRLHVHISWKQLRSHSIQQQSYLQQPSQGHLNVTLIRFRPDRDGQQFREGQAAVRTPDPTRSQGRARKTSDPPRIRHVTRPPPYVIKFSAVKRAISPTDFLFELGW